jgi:ribonuclease D
MFGDTPLVMIEDDESLARLCVELKKQPVIGVDTEADSFHHYKERLCLVQVSDPTTDYIIDPLKLSDLDPLKAVLEDPEVLIILHGGDYDVVSLKRDYGVQIRNIFDTMIAAQFLGLPRIGLADLIDRFFGYKVDKRFQRHDWTRRPLLEEHVDYARGDTHFLLALREVLSHRLRRKGLNAAHSEECALLEDREWKRKTLPEQDFYRVKGSRNLDASGMRILRALWHFRDGEAERLDRPAFKVVPDPVLVKLATTPPQSMDDLHRIIRAKSSMARRYGAGLLEAVERGVADESPLPARPKKLRKSDRRSSSKDSPSMDRLLGPLRDWRNALVNDRNLSPVVVVSNQQLKEIARVAPANAEELGGIPGVRQWQVRAYGDALLKIVAGVEAPARKRRRKRRKAPKPSPEG